MKTKQEKRQRRKYHVRNRLMRDGAPARLTVSRSSKHIYAQIVDSVGRTLCGTGTTKKSMATELAGKKKTERAAVVGRRSHVSPRRRASRRSCSTAEPASSTGA